MRRNTQFQSSKRCGRPHRETSRPERASQFRLFISVYVFLSLAEMSDGVHEEEVRGPRRGRLLSLTGEIRFDLEAQMDIVLRQFSCTGAEYYLPSHQIEAA